MLWSYADHIIKMYAEFLGCCCDVLKPCVQVARSEKPAEIQVFLLVAEPTPHLHECVVHLGAAQKVADSKTFKSESARQLISADHHRVKARVPVQFVVDRVQRGAINRPMHYARYH